MGRMETGMETTMTGGRGRNGQKRTDGIYLDRSYTENPQQLFCDYKLTYAIQTHVT